jgi:hypothetical protein
MNADTIYYLIHGKSDLKSTLVPMDESATGKVARLQLFAKYPNDWRFSALVEISESAFDFISLRLTGTSLPEDDLKVAATGLLLDALNRADIVKRDDAFESIC